MNPRVARSKNNHERWLVSYADFITLLFAFFVVLYAFAKRRSKEADAGFGSHHFCFPSRSASRQL